MSKQIYAIAEDENITPSSFVFESLSEAGRAFGLTTATVAYHVKRGTPINGYRLVTRQLVAHKNVKDKGIDGEGNLVRYDTSQIHVCITPCPYAEAPKPMVGSASCMRCSCFLGKDTEKKIVRCKFKIGHSKMTK